MPDLGLPTIIIGFFIPLLNILGKISLSIIRPKPTISLNIIIIIAVINGENQVPKEDPIVIYALESLLNIEIFINHLEY